MAKNGAKSSRSRFIKMLAASAVVHVFLTPFPALLGLIAMLPALQVSDEGETIEIELTSLPIAQQTANPQRPSEPQDEPPKQDPVLPEPAAPSETAPKDPESLTKSEAEPPAPKVESPKPSEKLAPNELYSDPIALAGNAADLADSNANVRLFIFADVIRDQPLGPRVGALLKRTPQWRDFFGPSDIDPIRDVDRVLIAGPQLRNSSQVVAVVQHHLKREKIDAALELLVQNNGEWIDREARLVRADADRASRLFSAPNEKVVVVAPPKMEEQLRKLGEQSTFARADGNIALSAYVVTPHRVAKGTGLALPESIKWARLDLRPTAEGGGILKILAQDKDAQTALENAQLFQQLIDQVASIDLNRGGGLGALASMLLGSQKVRMLKEAHFSAKKDQIEGTIVATRDQLMNLADLLEAFLPPSAAAPRSGSTASQPTSPQTDPVQGDQPAATPKASLDAEPKAQKEGSTSANEAPAPESTPAEGSQTVEGSQTEPTTD